MDLRLSYSFVTQKIAIYFPGSVNVELVVLAGRQIVLLNGNWTSR